MGSVQGLMEQIIKINDRDRSTLQRIADADGHESLQAMLEEWMRGLAADERGEPVSCFQEE